MFHNFLRSYLALSVTSASWLAFLTVWPGTPTFAQSLDEGLSRFLTSPPAESVIPQSGDSLENERREFLKNFRRIGMNTTADDATLLRILVESTRALRGVEVGSANGYGAIHMGMGFERTGGTLTTIDINSDMVRQCQSNIEKTKLQETVTCVQGDALQVLKGLEGPFDFVFIDAAKEQYLGYFRLLEPKLEAGSLIVADNVIQFADEMSDFLDAMRSDQNYEMVIVRASLEKEDGMAIIYKRN